MRLRRVSIGSDANPALNVALHPNTNEARNESFAAPGKSGRNESYMPNCKLRKTVTPAHAREKPLYNPAMPFVATVFLKTSVRLLNIRGSPLLAARILLNRASRAKSNGYNNTEEAAPAAPPEAKLPANHFQQSFL